MTNKSRTRTVQVFSASLNNIIKAFEKVIKTRTDPCTKLSPQFWHRLGAFTPKSSDKIAPFRGEGIDYKIELTDENGNEATVPWGPLYNMSYDELLVLRRTLTEYIDKG